MSRRWLAVRALALVILSCLMVAAHPVLADTAYVVQPGDTLFSISRRFGVSVSAIAAANKLVNPNLIYVGATLVIPDNNPGPVSDPAPPDPDPAPAAGRYTVRRGDTLYRIAVSHGVTLQTLIQANGIANPSYIYPGQQLLIPGAQPSPPDPAPAPVAAPAPPSGNLLPNPSFEAGYSHLYGAPELQVPAGWQLGLDEGGRAPGTGLTYLRPESRVLPRWSLPAAEHDLFIWAGDRTVKVFKGGAPMSFRLTTRLRLEPGTYRFRAGYFSDLVAGYDNGRKIWAPQPAAGEVAFVLTGAGSGWQAVTAGTRAVVDQTFTIDTVREVDIGLAFRTRYALLNNGFFLDDWNLQRLGP